MAVIATKETKLGLDLQGGVSLVYQGKPTKQQPTITQESLDRAVDIIRERVDSLGVAEPSITPLRRRPDRVDLPAVEDAERAADRVGTTAQLYFYDWEKNLLDEDCQTQPGHDRTATAARTQITGFYNAVQARPSARRSRTRTPPSASETRCYGFNKTASRSTAGSPRPTRRAVGGRAGRREARGRRGRSRSRAGILIVRAEAPDEANGEPGQSRTPGGSCTTTRRSTARTSRTPSRTSTSRPTSPIVTMDFTDKGKRSSSGVTRAIASPRHGQRAPGRRPDRRLAALRDRARQRAGLGARTSTTARTRTASTATPAPRSPARFTIESAQDLANFLKIGALPIRLELISRSAGLGHARQAGARPGPQGGHRRLHHRRALPAGLLPRPRRHRRRRAGHLRAVLLRAGQAHPDRPDAAGHRGPDPHARRRGGREHRHLRTRQGGGQTRADRRARPSPRATRRASRRSSTPTSSRSSSRSSSSSSRRRASRASRSRSASARIVSLFTAVLATQAILLSLRGTTLLQVQVAPLGASGERPAAADRLHGRVEAGSSRRPA